MTAQKEFVDVLMESRLKVLKDKEEMLQSQLKTINKEIEKVEKAIKEGHEWG